MRFSHKVAVVTGGSSGIGMATTRILHEEGARVYNLDVVESQNHFSRFIECDVADYDQVSNAIQKILNQESTIDVAFVNAGVHKFANIEETSMHEFLHVMSVNCFGAFYVLKEVLPVMKKNREGSILLMGSDQSVVGKGSSSAYGMSKGAIGQLVKSTAIDYAEFNIRVNCICPGTCDTPLLSKAIKELQAHTHTSNESILEMLKQAQPVNRIARPEEIARMACFLLSPENSFMTGALVPVDGGYTCQ